MIESKSNNGINAADFEKLVDKCVTLINSKIQREKEPIVEEKDIIEMIDKRLKEENRNKTFVKEDPKSIFVKKESKSLEKDENKELSFRPNVIESAKLNGKFQYILEEKIRETIKKQSPPKKNENQENQIDLKDIKEPNSHRKKSLTPNEIRNKLKRNSTKDNESITSKNEKQKKRFSNKQLEKISIPNNNLNKNLNKNFNENANPLSEERIIIEENSQLNNPISVSDKVLTENNVPQNEEISKKKSNENIKRETLTNKNSFKFEGIFVFYLNKKKIKINKNTMI